MKKTLLLDIDHTCMDGRTVRPYFKEFILRMIEKFNVGFYTAADSLRVTEICRVLFHDFKMDREVVRDIQRRSLSRDNCPMIWHYPSSGGSIEIKCLKAASEKLGVKQRDIILLDDAPTWEHPHAFQIIQAEGFMEWDVDTDEYFKDLDINPMMWSTAGGNYGADFEFEDGTLGDLKTAPKDAKNLGLQNSTTIINTSPKVGRNDNCTCGSGKKYKKCCINN